MPKIRLISSGYVRGDSKVGDLFEVSQADADELVGAGKATLDDNEANLAIANADKDQRISYLEGRVETLEGEVADLRQERDALQAQLDAPADPTTATDQGENSDAPTVTALPEDFPHRDKLIAGMFSTLEAVQKASDEELDAVPGIGGASIQEIRAALPEQG